MLLQQYEGRKELEDRGVGRKRGRKGRGKKQKYRMKGRGKKGG